MRSKFTYLKSILAIAIVSVLMLSMCFFVSASDNSAAELRIAYCNLSFESDTHIMYAIKSNDENVKLLVWSEPQKEYTLGTQKAIVSPFEEQMTINEELYTVFKYTGVAAKQMTDNVYVRACIDNGNGDVTYGDVHKYSILQYAYNKLGKTGVATTNEKLINMLERMLAYGASAQEYHNYKTDRLATDKFVQVKLTEGTLPDGFKHGLYCVGESVTISAPTQNAEGAAFTQWKDNTGTVIANTADYILTAGNVNNTYTPEYIKYSSGLEFETNDDGTCYLIGIGDCTDTDIKIPAKSPDGDTVIGIDRNAFSGETSITSVSIPSSVEEIGRNAFNGCTALTDVYYDGTEADWAFVDIASGNTVLEDAVLHYAIVETFTVIFVDYDGRVLKTETVNKGAAATAPAVSGREGYLFGGWDKEFTCITENLTVTAVYNSTITEPTIMVSDDTASAGDTLTVTVQIAANPGVAGAKFTLAYDSALTLINAVKGEAFSSLDYTPPAALINGCPFNWDSLDAESKTDGTILTLTFKVSDTVSVGEKLNVSVSYVNGDVYNAELQNLTFNLIDGTITIK